jgi:RimJ/RimL family protein N-acetyltransferase
MVRLEVEWQTPDGLLRAYEPNFVEVERQAEALAEFYNEAHNRSMMANTALMSATEVVEHFAALWRAGGKPFLLERDGELAGDADLRGIGGGEAEFAMLVGRRQEQGKGMGTRFALMLHALAFRELGLDRIFVSILPFNQASLRLFEKLGYTVDNSPPARATIDDESDVTLSLYRAEFEKRHADGLGQVTTKRRYLPRI